MTPMATLGGFKILKDVVRFSLLHSEPESCFPARLTRSIAEEKINLPYFTCVHDRGTWGVNIMADAADERRLFTLMEGAFGEFFHLSPDMVILSVFPHKNNPAITGALFESLGQEGLEPDALANSPSALSAVLKEMWVSKASDALFGPFSFSSYRTPSDWKLAQQGKEALYKEVVASYQEKRPKVYALNYRDNQELVLIRMKPGKIGALGRILKALAQAGFYLTFLSTSPFDGDSERSVFFCLPRAENRTYMEIIGSTAPGEVAIESACPAGTFSMTGPHFGDRYGIASELLTAFERQGLGLMGLNCTVASIRGVVPPDQVPLALHAIQECFEVPTVTKRD